jgi:hypothetical protein
MQKYTSCGGFDCRGIITFTPEAGDGLVVKTFVQQEMIRQGVLWGGFHNMSYSHSDADVAAVLAAYAEVLPMLKEAIENNNVAEQLRGEVLEMVFRKAKY